MQQLEHLAKSKMVFMDGTFKSVSELAYQLYSFHGFLSNIDSRKTVPLLYCIAPDKKGSTYDLIFKTIVELTGEKKKKFRPEFSITDFEEGAINAAKKHFKGKHKGCAFHLGQNLYTHLTDFGLMAQYAKDPELRLTMHKFKALSYLPAREITNAFQALEDSLPENVKGYAEYFRRTCVGSTKKQAKFPPQLWSQFDLFEGGLPRTQNGQEAWHKR